MGVLSLIAKLGMDASGFRAGLKQSQSAADKFGKNVGGSLKNQLAAAFGTAAIVSSRYKASRRLRGQDRRSLTIRSGVSKKALQEFDYAAQQNSAASGPRHKTLQKSYQLPAPTR
jgi:hypothetical protein